MHGVPVFLIVPLFAGVLCSLMFMCMKRALHEGASVWRSALWFNVSAGAMVLPLLFFAETPACDARVYQPLVPGLLFVIGAMLWALALSRGDVSVMAPVMGTKVLLVGFATVVFLRVPVRPVLWVSAGLVVVALTLMRGAGHVAGQRFWPTVLLTLCAATGFALSDIGFQAWAPLWGFGLFIPMAIGGAGAVSLAMVMLFRSRQALSATARRWLVAACLLNGVQVLAMSLSLSLLQHENAATAINIVYNSRSVISVVLVWSVGHWFGNVERGHGASVMAARAVGAVLLMAAIVLTILAA